MSTHESALSHYRTQVARRPRLTPEMERALARLYTDSGFRHAFLCDPEAALSALDLTAAEKADLAAMDRAGLVMAAASYRHKRESRGGSRGGVRSRLARWIRRS